MPVIFPSDETIETRYHRVSLRYKQECIDTSNSELEPIINASFYIEELEEARENETNHSGSDLNIVDPLEELNQLQSKPSNAIDSRSISMMQEWQQAPTSTQPLINGSVTRRIHPTISLWSLCK